MTTRAQIIVRANPDADDCLADAAASYVAEHALLRGWDLAPRWTDETRERVTLTVPGWHAGGGGRAVTPKRTTPRASGPTQTNDARRAAGRVRVGLWLPAEAAARLDEECRRTGRTRAELVAVMVEGLK